MKTLALDLPTFGFIVATRVALGAGIGLLVSRKLSDSQRRRLGTVLAVAGAASTIPAAIRVARAVRSRGRTAGPSVVDRDERLIGATRFARKGDEDDL